ncbi:D-2-hydroxyacid dehydrogenase [Bacillus sp. FJAT-50079]|uniref:D-2-hydroxyacid dehydrogenase n=1 Tax=Bacillus sp. FJAT-50079 TaxID=2833577 RepID=UPI001BC9EFDF|nr:D-2-hydroxyacid dehydrogenase [Bacillus sp. FJAT-50079]MBS4207681.1 D-2-hydroxyacid dehydrogenase [Bacillus sp. FJAT-50079]
MLNIVVLDGYTLNPGDLDWAGLEKLGKVTIYDRTHADEIVPRSIDAQIVLTNKTPMTSETLAQLPKLQYIGVLATGYNIVDTEAAKNQGIAVANVPTYSTHSVAQFVFALLMELCHRVQRHSDAVFEGEWTRSVDFSFTRAPLIELANKTIGLIGLGRIGRQTAQIAQAFGMHVLAVGSGRRTPPEIAGVEWVELNELLERSDVVSLHCPMTPSTERMLNAERIALMKPSAILINTSRGQLIEDQALADALNEGTIAGAALDVLSTEPPTPDNPLLSARNCVITPHIAWATKEARGRLMEIAVKNVQCFINGKAENIVN